MNRGNQPVRTTALRAAAGVAFAIGLPLATAGIAAAQSGPSGPSAPSGPTTTACPSGPSGASGCTTTSSTTATTVTANRPGGTGGSGGSGLARTGADAALPLAASAAAITVVLGGRRLASRLS
jgi:hypothetical protein